MRAILHSPVLTLLLICCAALLCPAHVMSADYTVPGTTLRLPEELAGFTRGEAKSYSPDNAAMGTAVPFATDTAEATFFIRPLEPNEKQKTAQDLVDNSLSIIDEMESRGIYTDVKKFEGSEPEDSPWRSGAFMAKSEGKLFTSYIYCRIAEGRSVKIRLSLFDVKDAKNHTKFIEELRALIDAALKSP
jgi:hypothetical protein